MADDLGVWQPLTPDEMVTLFHDLPGSWWVAGGWAIDLFLGHQTREHADLDVVVCRDDQLAVQSHLRAWDLEAADPPGTLRPWLTGEFLHSGVHDVWCRESPDTPWKFQLMLEEQRYGVWIFRQDSRMTLPIDCLGRRSAGGIPYITPEVQLLYKAKRSSLAKNELDFAVALPHLDDTMRAWLSEALAIVYPAGHRWIRRLGG